MTGKLFDSGDLIYDGHSRVNREKSRRVIFKIRLRSTEQRHMAGGLPTILPLL